MVLTGLLVIGRHTRLLIRDKDRLLIRDKDRMIDKHQQCKLQRRTSRKGMQQPNAASTRAQPDSSILILPLCYLHLVAASCSHLTSLQLALVVFFCHQLVQMLHLHPRWSSTAACSGGVFM